MKTAHGASAAPAGFPPMTACGRAASAPDGQAISADSSSAQVMTARAARRRPSGFGVKESPSIGRVRRYINHPERRRRTECDLARWADK
jgi:hypothetical protein